LHFPQRNRLPTIGNYKSHVHPPFIYLLRNFCTSTFKTTLASTFAKIFIISPPLSPSLARYFFSSCTNTSKTATMSAFTNESMLSPPFVLTLTRLGHLHCQTHSLLLLRALQTRTQHTLLRQQRYLGRSRERKLLQPLLLQQLVLDLP